MYIYHMRDIRFKSSFYLVCVRVINKSTEESFDLLSLEFSTLLSSGWAMNADTIEEHFERNFILF